MEEKMTNKDLLDEILVSNFDDSSYEMNTYYKENTIVVAGCIQIND